jgi:hypothetical protein
MPKADQSHGIKFRRFERTRQDVKEEWKKNPVLYLSKWIVPFLFCGCGWEFQSVCLHMSTYAYVKRIDLLEFMLNGTVHNGSKTAVSPYYHMPPPKKIN